ncbi:MAG: diaminopimelate decarboxylase [Candidatus Omnitrophota bacterium]|nr:diaminopimelate decarboxylase [Candidatus Omnitrophota bacterium]
MHYPHDFQMVGGELHCERVAVRRIAQTVGTPVYVYSFRTLVNHLRGLQQAFRSLRPLICFSVKANGNLAILRLLVQRGAGLDIVSGGELYKALRVGCPPSRIVFASVGKQDKEIREALRAGIFCFNVESAPELEAIDRCARRLRTTARVALRINPDVDANTHRHITTGIAESKFGIDPATALALLRRAAALRGVRFLGVHVHIGSQITQARPFLHAIRRTAEVVIRARRLGVGLEWLNLGGGLGIIYKDEQPQTPQAFASAVLPLLQPLRVRLILEPGRFIVGNAGVLVTRVLYVKPAPRRRFAVVDAGMNDLIRPALYGAYHEVVPVRQDRPPSTVHRPQRYDVVGPICESADVLARDRRLGPLHPRDLLAVLGAGAYGSTMASNYNGRLRPAEVLVRGRRWALIRRRETRRDLIRHDVIPRALLK